ncbi:uncharacterized protein SRS1_10281 [Sporisorium reilianum f. sp. reilianum]|uniref:Secreted protein n=1 Tax=Sporisorium reilianum f. sp. reilianum TaxID=72559 RepID=A0A2N8U8A2_9BASI|nr:uncharacterized protein SRS1_10281 [Sporisorium reilianum f. sp. reilianum]
MATLLLLLLLSASRHVVFGRLAYRVDTLALCHSTPWVPRVPSRHMACSARCRGQGSYSSLLPDAESETGQIAFPAFACLRSNQIRLPSTVKPANVGQG